MHHIIDKFFFHLVN